MKKAVIAILLWCLGAASFSGAAIAASEARKNLSPVPPQLRDEIWALTSSDEMEEARAAFKLRGMKEAPLAVPYLIRILHHDTPVEFRWGSKEKLADQGSPDFILKTTAGREAKETILKVGKPAIEPLMASLAAKKEPARVRAIVIDLLAHFRDVRAVDPLISSLKDDDAAVRSKAASALGDLGDVRAVEPLIAALKDKALTVSSSARTALGKLDDSRAIEVRINRLKDKNSVVRWEAADQLGDMADARAMDPLIAVLKDDDPLVRASAAEALGKIGDARAADPLLAALDDVYQRVQMKAALALADLGEARAVELLIGKMKDKNSAVQMSAVEALGILGDSRAVEPLIELLRAKKHTRDDWEIQMEIIQALQRITKQYFRRDREAWLAWWDEPGK